MSERVDEALVEPFAHDRVEALAVVVDDPPGVAQPVFPAFEQRLEDVALVELGIADQRDHPAVRAILPQPCACTIILHEARKEGLRRAKADRAGGEIDVVEVLGARGIGLRAAEPAKVLQLVARLVAEQVLDGVEDRAVRFA